MNAKKISVIIFLIIFIIFGTVSAVAYDKTDSVDIICYKDSYAEEYAKKHNIDYELFSDSDAYIGILNIENFHYNKDGTIVSYSGDSEKIAIPTDIAGTEITKVSEKTFENAKNLKKIYLPKSVTEFEPKELSNVTVYMYEDTDLYKSLSKDEEVKFEVKTIADSYFVDFYSANIPFSYDISGNNLNLNRCYYAYKGILLIPETIDGKTVTALSFDVWDYDVDVVVIPASVTEINGKLYSDRYDLTFLIGILIALVGTIVASIFVLTLKVDSKEKLFLTVPQIRAAYIVTLLSIILAGVYMFVAAVPGWVVYIGVALVYGFAALRIVKAKAAKTYVEEIDEKVKVKTFFIKSLTVDAEVLMNATAAPETKALSKKVFEAVRYSDPMSNAALVEAEEKIQNCFNAFEAAVKAEDSEAASSTAEELLSLIDIRNKKCKILK